MDSSLHAKRKAEDSPETHPARRSCHDSADKPSPSVIGRIAEEGSINSIIRSNNPRRLFTKPIAWTSEHLQLLDCKLEFRDAQLETEDEPSRQDLPAHVQIDAPGQTKRSKSSKEVYSVKSALIRKTLLRSKKSTLWEILDAYNIRPEGLVTSLSHVRIGVLMQCRSECLSFSYNLRKTSRLPTNGVFASDTNPATLAYITFDHIQDLRSTHMRLYKASYLPILRHYYPSEVPESMSSDLLEDAYIVAVFIALAQTQRRRQQSRSQATDTETDSSSPEKGPRPSEGTKQMLPTTAQSFKVWYGPLCIDMCSLLSHFTGPSSRYSGRTGAEHLYLHCYHFCGVPRQVRQTMALLTIQSTRRNIPLLTSEK